ncbi:MAG: pentapeptide repeat-containing protein, partial [Blastocatellia bacterium]
VGNRLLRRNCSAIRDEGRMANEEHLKSLKEAIEDSLTRWDEWRSKNRVLDLSGVNLSSADLVGANLKWADLRRSDLSSARLQRSNLRFANLGWANLKSTYLNGANLSNVLLNNSNLSGADLSSAILCEAYLVDADLTGANLSDADMSGAHVGYTYFPMLISAELRVSNWCGIEGFPQSTLIRSRTQVGRYMKHSLRDAAFQTPL